MGSTNIQETRRSICMYSKQQELQVQCECVVLQCDAFRVQIPKCKHIRHFSATHSPTQAHPAPTRKHIRHFDVPNSTTPHCHMAPRQLFLSLSFSLSLSLICSISSSFAFSLLLSFPFSFSLSLSLFNKNTSCTKWMF